MTHARGSTDAAPGRFVLQGLAALLASLALSGVLLAALALGAKWGLAVVAALIAGGVVVLARDRRFVAALGVAAAVPIGVQYGLLSHGGRYDTYTHFGGAPAEPMLNLVDIPILLLAILFVVDLGLGRRRLPAWTRLDTVIAVALALSLASVANTSEYALLFFEMARYGKYLLLYWALRTCVDRSDWIWGFTTVSLGVLALQGVVAMAQYFLYFTLPLPVGGVSESAFELIGGEIIQRVTGFLGHSNTFAAYLLVPLALGALLLVTRVRVILRLAALPALALGMVAMLLTFSRNGLLSSALLVLLVAGLAIATGRLPRATPIAVVGVALFVILLVFGFGLDEVTLRSWGLLGEGAGQGVISAVMTRIAYDPGKAVESRLDLLRIAGEMVRQHPLLGIGLNSFEENMALYDRAGTVQIIQQPVHNIFALVAAETGLPSLCAWLVAGLLLLRCSWRLLRSGGEAAFLAGGLGVSTIVLLSFSNLFDLTLRKEPLLGMLTLVAALVVTMSAGSRADVDGYAQTSGR